MPVLVIQTAFLGDVVLTTPLLDELARQHGPVDIVTTPAAAPLVETHPAVRRAIRYDKKGSDRGLAGFHRMTTALRSEQYSRVYLPHQSWRSGMLARFARIPERVGFSTAPAKLCYTERIERPTQLHETGRLLSLAGLRENRRPTMVFTDDDGKAAKLWGEAVGLPSDYVAMAPGSVWATKRWGGYPDLASAIDTPIAVVGGDADRELGKAICDAAPGRAWNAAGILSLRASAALIADARALVTNDSLPLHVAQATGTPTVAIFGPTASSMGFGPQGTADRTVELGSLSCRPCSSHGPQVCPLKHHRCMADLGTAMVQSALLEII